MACIIASHVFLQNAFMNVSRVAFMRDACESISYDKLFHLLKNNFSETCSTRFVVKPEEGQQCIFGVFLTKPVKVNENLGS